ncbi:septation protein IspZ [Aliigemmobacter aestuarii]|uniref:Inner membrane-spanning protein YciB n=1 Tax=Aliigemmobacter aestuarii TaxID=1445661 RepID=A0A4S3ML95_9RHOB|nr:inner membrane-spanning protein YciB [Gemmobacter aestuarii]THD82259.1 septation protein IspZ [Gemmobacter aestuarii]
MTEKAEKKVNGWVRAALEYGPIIAFFVGYVRLKDRVFTIGGTEYSGFILVTAAFVPLMILTTLAMWRLTGRLSKMQVATVVLVTVFGGLSVWLNDERFFKMKPTMIYLLFAGLLGLGLMRGQSWLKAVLGEHLPMAEEGWMILTKRFTLFFLALAAANEGVWRLMSTDAWVNFKTFGLPVAMFAFLMLQSRLFQKYGTGTDE